MRKQNKKDEMPDPDEVLRRLLNTPPDKKRKAVRKKKPRK